MASQTSIRVYTSPWHRRIVLNILLACVVEAMVAVSKGAREEKEVFVLVAIELDIELLRLAVEVWKVGRDAVGVALLTTGAETVNVLVNCRLMHQTYGSHQANWNEQVSD